MKRDQERLEKLVAYSVETRKRVAQELREEGRRLIVIADAVHHAPGRSVKT